MSPTSSGGNEKRGKVGDSGGGGGVELGSSCRGRLRVEGGGEVATSGMLAGGGGKMERVSDGTVEGGGAAVRQLSVGAGVLLCSVGNTGWTKSSEWEEREEEVSCSSSGRQHCAAVQIVHGIQN